MSDLTETFFDFLEAVIPITVFIAIAGYIILSIVLFIKDGINAKKEGRRRSIKIIVMFVIAMTVVGMIVVGYALLMLLLAAIMRSM
ncbi:MAG: hypothetical protein J6X33_01130 [Clostridiales bacterium]|nr:hypothetical protein [Clostridiales bacterium]